MIAMHAVYLERQMLTIAMCRIPFRAHVAEPDPGVLSSGSPEQCCGELIEGGGVECGEATIFISTQLVCRREVCLVHYDLQAGTTLRLKSVALTHNWNTKPTITLFSK